MFGINTNTLVEIIIRTLFQKQVRYHYKSIDFDAAVTLLVNNPEKFWEVVQRRFSGNDFAIKGKVTKRLLAEISDVIGSKITNDIAYIEIREQWFERFRHELPPEKPLYNGQDISLSWLLMELVRSDTETPLFVLDEDQREFTEEQKKDYAFQELLRDPALKAIVNVEGLGEDFLRLLHYDIGVLWPPQPNVLEAFSRFFLRLTTLAREASDFGDLQEYFANIDEVSIPTFITVACPDYEYTEDGAFVFNPERKSKALGNKVGYAPLHTARGFRIIWSWLKESYLHHFVRFKVIIADIEAYNDLNLDLVQETKEGFLEKCRQSNQAFKDALPADMQSVTEMLFLTEVLGDSKKHWDGLYNQAISRVRLNDWPLSHIDFEVEQEMRKAFVLRRGLYRNWIPEQESEELWEELAFALFCDHVAQHAVTGKVLTDMYQYPCDFQGESHHLRKWMNVMNFEVLPIFYMERLLPKQLRDDLQLAA